MDIVVKDEALPLCGGDPIVSFALFSELQYSALDVFGVKSQALEAWVYSGICFNKWNFLTMSSLFSELLLLVVLLFDIITILSNILQHLC